MVRPVTFVDVEAVAAAPVASRGGRGRGRGRGRPRRRAGRPLLGEQGAGVLDEKSKYWLLTVFWAVLVDGEWVPGDDGRGKDQLLQLLAQLSEEVPARVDYLVAGFETCRGDEDTPGRPHAHIYIEFRARKRGRYVQDLFPGFNPHLDRVSCIDPRSGIRRSMDAARISVAAYCKKGAGTAEEPVAPDVLEWGTGPGVQDAKAKVLADAKQMIVTHRPLEIPDIVSSRHHSWLDW